MVKHCLLDELEVETQHFSKLVNDARRKFKDFLMAMDKLNPFLVEMYVRNSLKQSRRRKASSTPYHRLRQDNLDSSDENIPQTFEEKNTYQWSYMTGVDNKRASFAEQSKCIGQEDIHCKNGSPFDSAFNPYVNNGRATAVIKRADVLTKERRVCIQQRVSSQYYDGTVSEATTVERGSKVASRTLYVGFKRLSCTSADFTNQSTPLGGTSKQNYKQIQGSAPVLSDILNADNFTCKSGNLSSTPFHNDQKSENGLPKNYILLPKDTHCLQKSPILPSKLRTETLLDCGHINGTASAENCVMMRRTADNGEPTNNEQTKNTRQGIYPELDTSHSDCVNISYSKDQRKRLKKRMKNALKKPENCCFMGQV